MVSNKREKEFSNLVVDASHLAYRVFFALPDLSQFGTNTHMVHGFLTSLLSVVKQFPFHELIIALDGGSGRKRALYQGYKVRTPSEEPLDLVRHNDFNRQFDIIVDILTSLGVKQCYCDSVEADDVIAHICNKNWVSCEDYQYNVPRPILILSGDHDLYALLQDDVSLWIPHKEEIYTIEKFRETFLGLEPFQYRDMMAFMGCSGDNVPGVKGIGPSYAAKLIKTYGSLDGVFNADPTKDRLVKLAQDNRDMVEISLKLVSFLDIEPIMFHHRFDFARARKLLYANGLMALIESWSKLENLSKL